MNPCKSSRGVTVDGDLDSQRHNCKEPPLRAPITGGLPRSSPTPRDPRVVTLSLFFSPSFFPPPALLSLLVNVLLQPTLPSVMPSTVWIVQLKHSK